MNDIEKISVKIGSSHLVFAIKLSDIKDQGAFNERLQIQHFLKKIPFLYYFVNTIVIKCYWGHGLSRIPRRSGVQVGTFAIMPAGKAYFCKVGDSSAPHELNKAIGRNFHFMDWHGAILLFLWNKFVMELAVYSVIRPMCPVKLSPLRWETLTFRLHSVTKFCLLLVQHKCGLNETVFMLSEPRDSARLPCKLLHSDECQQFSHSDWDVQSCLTHLFPLSEILSFPQCFISYKVQNPNSE